MLHTTLSAYWTTTESERQMYMHKSLSCSEMPILVPCIVILAIQAESEDVLAGTKSDEDSTNSSVDSDHEYLSANTSKDESESIYRL